MNQEKLAQLCELTGLRPSVLSFALEVEEGLKHTEFHPDFAFPDCVEHILESLEGFEFELDDYSEGEPCSECGIRDHIPTPNYKLAAQDAVELATYSMKAWEMCIKEQEKLTAKDVL